MKIDRAEKNRLNKLLKFEKKARLEGFNSIAGVDEAGRGPLAGPVVAAACIMPPDLLIPYIDDSKKLTAEVREDLFVKLTTHPEIRYGVGIMDHLIVDEINIYQASIQAMLAAVSQLEPKPDILFVDGLKLPHAIPCWKIIGGDALSLSIGAASIIAKVTRDRIMKEMHEQWPQYGFKTNKGYSTEFHLEALDKWGPCPIHRKSFAPVMGIFNPTQPVLVELS